MGYPTCDCAPTGGFSETGTTCSGSVCDAHPGDWHHRIDEHGCVTYDIGFTLCCNCDGGGFAP